MRRQVCLAWIGAVAAAGLLLEVEEAWAIAAFSREHNTECSTCHTVYPQRNEFGEAFRKNGYVWPGKAPAARPAGDEALWRSGLPRVLPLSVSLYQTLDYDPKEEDDKLNPSTDLQLHVGGAIRDLVGVFAHDLTGSAEVFGVFRRLLGTPLNVKYGNIIPQTTLWKPNQGVTVAPLAVHALTVGQEPALGTPRDGLELNAVLGSRLFAAVGGADRSHQDAMDYYGHLAWKIGGTDFLGREPEVDFDKESVWDFLTITLGGYGYVGRTKATDDRFYRAGVEAEAQYRGFTLYVSWLAANNRNADGTGLEVDSVVFAAEIDQLVSRSFLVSLRFENEDIGNSSSGITKRVIGGFTLNPVETLLIKLEARWERSEVDTGTSGALLVGYHL